MGCPEEVVGIDNDAVALRFAAENLERNGVTSRVRLAETPVAEVGGTFDLVLANILAPVLIDLAPAITERVAPGGRLILSGLMHGDVDEVVNRYRQGSAGALQLVDRAERGDWVALVLGRT